VTHALPGRGQTVPPRSTTSPIADAAGHVYKRSMWSLVLRGILALAIGLFVFVRPLASVATFALVIAIWALLDGFANIGRAFSVRRVVQHWWVLLVAGIIGVAFGAAALYYYPTLSLAFAVVWTAWWVLTASLMAVYVAVQERKIGVSWGWTMFLGILGIVVGIACLVYPGITLSALMGFIGVFAIVAGILMLVAAGKLRGVKQDVKKAFTETPTPQP